MEKVNVNVEMENETGVEAGVGREMSKQVMVYSVDTKAFYIEDEKDLYDAIIANHAEMEEIKDYILINMLDETEENIAKYGDRYNHKFEDYKAIRNYIRPENFDELDDEEKAAIKTKVNARISIRRYRSDLINRNKKAKEKGYSKLLLECIDKVEKMDVSEDVNGLKSLVTKFESLKEDNKNKRQELNNKVNKNKEQRELDIRRVSKNKAVALFDSYMLRVIGAESNLNKDKVNEDILIVKVSHLPLMRQLIKNGFTWGDGKDNEYVFYTASAGQIRQQKLVYMRKSVWEKYEARLMCGLTEEVLKDKKVNINKFLAYKALSNSATDVWKDFNIDECIVVPDFKTEVWGKVDYIDKDTFSITRKEMGIEIEHSDGCGLMLPEVSDRNMMCRLPGGFKGLLTPIDFIKWADKYNDGKCVVKDIWGKEWDLKEKGIKIIFSKSQFKLWKFYKDWDDFKANFINNGCHASVCNVEGDKFRRSSYNYQAWQSLTDVDDSAIKIFTNRVKEAAQKAHTDRSEMLSLFGADKGKTYMQKILSAYPEIISGDPYLQEELKDKINSMLHSAKSGKISLDAKYTYILPDTFAWLEWLIQGKEAPTGLLKDGEVYCNLYSKSDKLDINRSPSLYREHAVRKNVAKDNKIAKEWFNTPGLYTSHNDLISKILMFDVDGDKANVVAEPTIIALAERNMKDIVPLYYEMGVAGEVELSKDEMCKGLTAAFKHSNIGKYSNQLTRLWNIENPDLDTAKRMTALNNFFIDSAKTLQVITPPEDIQTLMDNAFKVKKTNEKGVEVEEEAKMPYFFQFVKKDYSKNKINKEIGNSTVDRICKDIEAIEKELEDDKYSFKNCGNFKRVVLMNNAKISMADDKVKLLMEKYDSLNENMQNGVLGDKDVDKIERFNLGIKHLRVEFEEFCLKNEIELSDAVDVVVKEIYTKRKTSKKKLMFEMLGDMILANIQSNLKKPLMNGVYVQCQECGTRVKQSNNGRKKYCDKCSDVVNARKAQETRAKKRTKKVS